MKTLIIGNLTKVEEIKTKDTYSSQNIEITVQEYDTSTGTAKEPQVFPITIFNKKIAELKAPEHLGKNVHASCWLKSLKNDKEGRTFYNVALNCTSLKQVQ